MFQKSYSLPLLKSSCLSLALLGLPLPIFQSAQITEQIHDAPVSADIHSALREVGSFNLGLYGITASVEHNQRLTHSPHNSLPAYQPLQFLVEILGEAIPALKQSENSSDVNVLITEVVVVGSNGQPIASELESRVYEAIMTESGATTTRSQLQQDINNIFATGLFANVQVSPENTPLGVRITFIVQPNPVLARVEVSGNNVLPESVVDRIFSPQYGRVTNLVELQDGIESLNQWYLENDYALAQVLNAPRVEQDGIVTLVVSEGVIEDIQIRFSTEEGSANRSQTRDFVITREIQTQPGDVFQRSKFNADLQRVFGLGIFNDVKATLEPGKRDSRKVHLIIDMTAGNTRSVAAGLGFNAAGDISIRQEYIARNLRGLAQKLDIKSSVGTGGNVIQGSLTSPGSRNGLPMQGTAFENDLTFRDHTYRASNVNQSTSFEQYSGNLTRLIDIARSTNQNALLILLLNNLGKVRQTHITPISPSSWDLNTVSNNTSEPFRFAFELTSGSTMNRGVEHYARLAIDSYTEAQDVLQIVNSPILEMIISVNQAQTHRKIGEFDASLQGYFHTINLSRAISSDMNFEQLLGNEVYDLLQKEWLLNETWDEYFSDHDLDFHEYLNVSLPLMELFILSDVISIYSESGDHQSAIYASRSVRLKDLNRNSIGSLSELLTRETRAALFSELESDSERLTVESFLSAWGSGAQAIMELLPEIYPLRSLNLVFSELGDKERSNSYDQEIKYISQQQKRQLTTFAYSLLEYFLNHTSLLLSESQDSQNLVEIIDETIESLPSLFDPSTGSWNRNELQELTDSFLSPVIDLISNSVDDIESYRSWLNSLPPLMIEYFFAEADNSSPVQAEEKAIRFYQTLLEDWPTDNRNEFISQIEILKGCVLKLKADSHYRLGDYELAIQAYMQSLRLIEREDNNNNLSSHSLNNIQDTFPNQINQILEMLVYSQRLDARLNLADSHLDSQNLIEARNWYESALELIRDEPTGIQLSSKQSDYSEVFYGLAKVNYLLNDFESARANIEQALSLNREFLPQIISTSRQGAVDLTLKYGYGIPRQGLISANFATPWNLSRTDAGENTSPFNRSLQNRCNKIAEHTSCRQKYFELYVHLLMTQHQHSPSQGFDILALEMAEQARISDYDSLQSQRSAPSSNQYLNQRRESLSVAQSFRAIQEEISDDETVVLSYFLGEDSSYLWLISQTGLQTHTLPPRDVIETQSREFYDLLTSPHGRVRPRTTAAAGQQLSDMILGPVAEQLGQKRLVVVGDGFLQYLPFGALPNLSPQTTHSVAALEGEFAPALNPLMLEHEIVSLPSASALVGLRENRNSRPRPQQELAFFANPVFSHRDPRVDSVRLAEGWEPFSPEDLTNVEVIYSQLPETERELENVLGSNLIPAHQVKTFWGHDANLEAALSPELGQHRIVHFASHGIFNSNAPDRSGVVLSGISEAGVVQSGLLSPRHAFNQMNLSATDLVVLSGCRTGLSEGQMGREGVTGLTSGLMAAGADRVVASLWSVRDDATRELMQRFYKGMKDSENPLTPAAALRAAQISMWEEAQWQAPYYWAAFTLQGEWE